MKPGGRLWLALCACLALGSLFALVLPTAALDWQPALAATEPWRWWTAAWVHWSTWHLAANLAALALVAALGRVAAVPAVIALAWVVSWPLAQLSLLLRPELTHFGGLSGLLHGGLTVVAVFVACTEVGRRRHIGLALIAGVATKIALEAPWGAALQHSNGVDIAIAPLAHLSGALWGAVCTLLALARGPEAPPVSATPHHDTHTTTELETP